MVSADYSATHPSQSVLFAPPTPRPNYWFFFFAFPVPLSHQSKGLETWRDAESKEVQTGSRSAAGWGGEEGPGSKGVSARTTEAEDEDRRRPALGGVPIARFCKS